MSGSAAAALWIADADGALLGSGFRAAADLVVTSAHGVHGLRGPLLVRGARGPARRHRVASRHPADPGRGGFHDFPDLALLAPDDPPHEGFVPHPADVPGPIGREEFAELVRDLPPADYRPSTESLARRAEVRNQWPGPWTPLPPHVAEFDAAGPPAGADVTVHGFSTYTPAAGAQADTRLLTVTGEAGRFLRAKGDEVSDGLSGAMVVRVETGRVCGVLKGSRDFDAARGGWFTPVTALLALVPGLPAVRVPASRAAADIRGELREALLRFPSLDDRSARLDLLRLMGEHLGMDHPFEAEQSERARTHIRAVVDRVYAYRDRPAALAALTAALTDLDPDAASLRTIRTLTTF